MAGPGPMPAPYTGPKELHYLFVDGASLHARIEKVSRLLNVPLEVDFSKVAIGFAKTFYYDAIPVQKPGEDPAAYETRISPQKDRHAQLGMIDRVHVYEGDARSRPKRGLEQKKVDVMIAVDMLEHTYRRNMHRATLLTGNLDFEPLVQALVREGMDITLWYPPGETSVDLLKSADTRRPLDLNEVAKIVRDGDAIKVPKVKQDRVPPYLIDSDFPSNGARLGQWSQGPQRVELWKHREGHTYGLYSWVPPVFVTKMDFPICQCFLWSKADVVRAVCAERKDLFGTLPTDLLP